MSKEPPKRPKLAWASPVFIDRNTNSDDMAVFLSDAGWPIERHHDYFADDVDDDVWIAQVAAKGWTILTADRRLAKDYIDVIIKSKAKVVLLADNNSGRVLWSAALVVGQWGIHQVVHADEGPVIMSVTRSGNVVRIRRKIDLDAESAELRTQAITRAKKKGTFDAEREKLTGKGNFRLIP
jgi:hypothetical protein